MGELLGMTGVVLRYRLGPKYKHPSMQFDVNRAIRMVRHNAKSWGIDPTRVGVLGFSAGGHEASTAATHYDTGKQDGDEIDKQSCRPDIAVLIYPVITMTDPFTHKGSRTNLLGKEPDPALVEKMSNEKQVTKDTPPTFLVHSSDDKTVPIENSFLFAQRWPRAVCLSPSSASRPEPMATAWAGLPRRSPGRRLAKPG